MYKITFLPDGRQVLIEEDETLLEAVHKAGLYIHSICGGEGTCGRCKLLVKKGEYKTKPTTHISREEAEKGYVLACQTHPKSDLDVEIPLESRIEGVYAVEDIAQKSELKVYPEVCSPLSKQISLNLPPPTLQDNISDTDRMLRELRRAGYRDVKVELNVTRKLADVLRAVSYTHLTLPTNREV